MQIPFHKYESPVEAHSNVSDALDGDDLCQVQELEDEFCKYIGCEYAHATSHGTSALHLAMLAVELKRGDKVVCSVNAHPSVPEVVRHFDAEPVFIDIDENSYNINLVALEKYLEEHQSKKLKAVIVSHIAGACVDLDALYEMGKRYDVKIIEDASDAIGATYKGQKIGSTGADITCFNFSSHLKKNICNGGMLVTNNEEVIKRATLLAYHGIERDENSLEYIYDVTDIGNDYSISQLNAAYIRAQIRYQDKNIARQREIAAMYNDSLCDVNHVKIGENISDEHPYFLYIVKIDKNRDSFATELKNIGVECGLHYIPLHLLSYHKSKYGLKINSFPVALRTFQTVLSLPIYPTMSDKEVEFVIDSIKKVAKTRV
ncbi:MAG: DegT/DnrJ/EryC1/StrS family aminotransferase [Campylobacterales bacterium]|nr:DegT/DnrJ/EryC1/StrS family aminotransferase [Campylobacterales bacterium]